MKRHIIFMLAWALCAMGAVPAARSQDAATEERLNRLSGQVEDLIAAQKDLRDQISALSRDIQSLREEQGKPNASSVSREDLGKLADAIKEVDRKRMEDAEKIRGELLNLGKALAASPPRGRSHDHSVPAPETHETTMDKTAINVPDKGFEHVVQSGETLSLIVQGCKEKNIRVTVDQILKANPGLKPERLHVGQKIFIPAAQS